MGLAVATAGLLQTRSVLYSAIGVCALGAVGLLAYSYFVWRDDPDRVTADRR